MDPLDDAFSVMRVRESLYARVDAGAPWAIRFKEGKAARFGLVISGACWLTTEQPSKSIPLAAGDCYVILDGSTYTLGDDPRSVPMNCFDVMPKLVDGAVSIGGGGAAATVVTGWFVYDELGARPLTALLLYMGEIKQHSHQFSQAAGNRVYLQQVVENALQQTERVCAMVKQIADVHESEIVPSGRNAGWETRSGHGRDGRAPGVMFSSSPGQKPLTRREREVLDLVVSEGCSNKEGALRMHISPRTFESHRAEAMRKLGARNTADLVRTALLHPGAV